ncbi:MAG: DUF5407 family protein [Waddliaceae bacterium]
MTSDFKYIGNLDNEPKWHSGFSADALFKLIDFATASAKEKLAAIQENRSAISIGDMFEMQMIMNRLSQLSEMATSVVSAAHTATMSASRNVKG